MSVSRCGVVDVEDAVLSLLDMFLTDVCSCILTLSHTNQIWVSDQRKVTGSTPAYLTLTFARGIEIWESRVVPNSEPQLFVYSFYRILFINNLGYCIPCFSYY